jgi:hypothetical protein
VQKLQDVVNSEDINIYRELAGGVTHNYYMVLQPIGGQSAIVKWKWGQDADEMLIKTNLNSSNLLGENVKQANRGINPTFHKREWVLNKYSPIISNVPRNMIWKNYNSKRKREFPSRFRFTNSS